MSNNKENLAVSLNTNTNTTSATASTYNKYSSSTNNVGSTILRLGETVESLFCLPPNTEDKVLVLCQNLAHSYNPNNPACTDTAATAAAVLPSQWLQALQYATSHAFSNASSNNNNIIRLHRRASTVLKREYRNNPITNNGGNVSSGSIHSVYEKECYLKVWLQYAQVQYQCQDVEGARRTYRHIKLDRIHFTNTNAATSSINAPNALYFITLASFEEKFGSMETAKEVLEEGLKCKAEPCNTIVDAHRLLIRRMNIRTMIPSLPGTGTTTNTGITTTNNNATTNSNNNNSMISSGSSNRKVLKALNITNDESSDEDITFNYEPPSTSPAATMISVPKDQQRGAVTAISAPSGNNTNSADVASPELEMSLSSNHHEDATLTVKVATTTNANASNNCSMKRVNFQQPNFPNPSPLFLPSSNSSNGTTLNRITSLTKVPSNLLKLSTKKKVASIANISSSTKASSFRLLQSAPQRQLIVPSQQQKQNEEEGDHDDTNEVPVPVRVSASEKRKKPNIHKGTTAGASSMITQSDIAYMLSWDPNAPRKKPSQEQPVVATVPSSTVNSTNNHTSSTDTNSTNTSTNSVSATNSTSGVNTNNTNGNNQICASTNNSTTSSNTNHTSTSANSTNRQKNCAANPSTTNTTDVISSSDYHPQYLPLASHSNILCVNGTSYSKLGVIGKGGSCKVYRVLSPDNYHIYALKKVRLEGMRQKEIDSYANEVALLKRLAGNVSIVKFVDSELDYVRKELLVVMEIGEADLNTVLQQQQQWQSSTMANSTNDDSNIINRTVNMNFIRLTWQQMLTAVHSIHEERIVHGDLKPANFLFVRGVLKLIDFGIAKAIQSDDTTNIYRESAIGTVNYMAPEAIQDSGVDGKFKLGRASDIWSLGCILYQMIYGKTPFADLKHMIRKCQAIVNPQHKIPFPDTADMTAVNAMKLCLQRRPSDRAPIVSSSADEVGLLNNHPFLHSSFSYKKEQI